MSKAVLLPIHPKYCELIADGEKTIEVRKTRPKLDTPFKCYIYCTKTTFAAKTMPSGKTVTVKQGKVIGEFVCDKIGEAHSLQDFRYAGVYKEWDDKADCLTNNQMLDYMGENDLLYGWHISDLVIYDEPKELGEFHHCGENYHYNPAVTRPPQSWCYVEELT